MHMEAFRRGFRAFLACSTAFAGLGLVSVANADVSDVFFTVEAWSGSSHGSYSVMTDDVDYDPVTQSWFWSGGGITVQDGSQTLVTIASASASAEQDPLLTIHFDIQAGNTDTIVQVTSALLSFPTINNPLVAASAGLTLTDSNAAGGASVDANQGSTGDLAWVAQYNGFVPGGTTFLEGIGDLAVAPADIAGSDDDNVNSGGLVPVFGAFSDMSMQYRFKLSANDSASGTSVYVAIPEPASVALLVLGGLAALRRR